MHVRSLAFRTDLALLERGGTEVTDRGTHLVVRTPGNPTFYWGNFMLLSEPPTRCRRRGLAGGVRRQVPRRPTPGVRCRRRRRPAGGDGPVRRGRDVPGDGRRDDRAGGPRAAEAQPRGWCSGRSSPTTTGNSGCISRRAATTTSRQPTTSTLPRARHRASGRTPRPGTARGGVLSWRITWSPGWACSGRVRAGPLPECRDAPGCPRSGTGRDAGLPRQPLRTRDPGRTDAGDGRRPRLPAIRIYRSVGFNETEYQAQVQQI